MRRDDSLHYLDLYFIRNANNKLKTADVMIAKMLQDGCREIAQVVAQPASAGVRYKRRGYDDESAVRASMGIHSWFWDNHTR